MEFRILGPLEVIREGRPVSLPRGRGRALLALLILRAGEVLSTERLIDELWGDAPPPTADKGLQNLVADLRRRLLLRGGGKKAHVLETRSPGYLLRIDREQVDANRFRRLVTEARGGTSPLERATKLREALDLWRGPALADFTYEPFAQQEIAGLEDLRLAAVEERIDADLRLGRHAELVAELETLVAEHPYRERLRGHFMQALYGCGRQADALEVYRDARRVLVEELGVEPGPELSELEQAILRQDPALRPAPGRALAPAETTVPTENSKRWLPEERKSVTVLFVELGISGDEDGADPEVVRRLADRSTEVAADVLRRHGASVEELVGEVLVGFFGLPVSYEDHAVRAVRAAAELRATLSAADEEQESRIRLSPRAGIESGEVVVGSPEAAHASVSGDPVNLAGTLMRVAKHGEVLLGGTIAGLLPDTVRLEAVTRPGLDATGISISIPASRLVDLAPDAAAIPRSLDAPMVGRADELARMQAAFGRATQRRAGHRFTVLGDAGVGKSRLAKQFIQMLGSEVRVLSGHCPAYGDGITFWPLREVVLEAAGAQEPEVIAELVRAEHDGAWITEQVSVAIGLTEKSGKPDELFPAIRRFFEAVASRHPLVVTFEDVHWAESTFLDLIEYLTDAVRGPLLLLCLARPELLEDRPGWREKGANADVLILEPLGPAETERLISDRLTGGTLPRETQAHIAQTAQGNPLFVEQMVAAFQNEGSTTVPPSVRALLAARLDRLGPAERDLLRCAAVMGREFTIEALLALVPEQARSFVGRHLETLERKQLIKRARSTGGEIGFRHVLIQFAAYRSTTRTDRAGLHEQYAEWLANEALEPPPELDEIVGYHLERAVKERRALGMPDDRDPPLAVRAGERLADAGLRAYARFDIPGAENLLSRAEALLPRGHVQRREVMSRLAEGYPLLGRHAEADEVLEALQDELAETGEPRMQQAARLERARVRLFTGPDPVKLDTLREEAEAALDFFDSSGDHAGVAQALFVLALVHRRMGAISEMEKCSRRGLDAARRAGHTREEAGARWNVAWAVQAGETPVREAIPVCEELVESGGILHPGVLCELAVLRAMVGEFGEADDLVARARADMLERDRGRRTLMYPAAATGSIAAMSGDLTAAERAFRAALEMARAMGAREHISQLAATLSLVLFAQRRPEEAGELATVGEESAPVESVASQAMQRAANAHVMMGRDGPAEATRPAREAVRLAPVEMPNLRADLLLHLAEVLRAAGDRKGDTELLDEAIDLYERKGNVVSVARARSIAQTER